MSGVRNSEKIITCKIFITCSISRVVMDALYLHQNHSLCALLQHVHSPCCLGHFKPSFAYPCLPSNLCLYVYPVVHHHFLDCQPTFSATYSTNILRWPWLLFCGLFCSRFLLPGDAAFVQIPSRLSHPLRWLELNIIDSRNYFADIFQRHQNAQTVASKQTSSIAPTLFVSERISVSFAKRPRS